MPRQAAVDDVVGAPQTRPATDKQIDWITQMLENKDLESLPAAPRALMDGYLSDLSTLREVDSRTASNLIGWLKPLTKKKTGGNRMPTPDDKGIWVTPDGQLWKLQISRESGRIYAQSLALDLSEDFQVERHVYHFAPGACFTVVNTGRRLTWEEELAHGIKYHFCVRCGAELDNDESKKRGLGPVCYAKGEFG